MIVYQFNIFPWRGVGAKHREYTERTFWPRILFCLENYVFKLGMLVLGWKLSSLVIWICNPYIDSGEYLYIGIWHWGGYIVLLSDKSALITGFGHTNNDHIMFLNFIHDIFGMCSLTNILACPISLSQLTTPLYSMNVLSFCWYSM